MFLCAVIHEYRYEMITFSTNNQSGSASLVALSVFMCERKRSYLDFIHFIIRFSVGVGECHLLVVPPPYLGNFIVGQEHRSHFDRRTHSYIYLCYFVLYVLICM